MRGQKSPYNIVTSFLPENSVVVKSLAGTCPSGTLNSALRYSDRTPIGPNSAVLLQAKTPFELKQSHSGAILIGTIDTQRK